MSLTIAIAYATYVCTDRCTLIIPSDTRLANDPTILGDYWRIAIILAASAIVPVLYVFLIYLGEFGMTPHAVIGLLSAIERFVCGATWLLWAVMWTGVWLEAGRRGAGRLMVDVASRW